MICIEKGGMAGKGMKAVMFVWDGRRRIRVDA